MSDLTLTCADCHQQFVYTSIEQARDEHSGIFTPPKYCMICRAKRAAEVRDKSRGHRLFG